MQALPRGTTTVGSPEQTLYANFHFNKRGWTKGDTQRLITVIAVTAITLAVAALVHHMAAQAPATFTTLGSKALGPQTWVAPITGLATLGTQGAMKIAGAGLTFFTASTLAIVLNYLRINLRDRREYRRFLTTLEQNNPPQETAETIGASKKMSSGSFNEGDSVHEEKEEGEAPMKAALSRSQLDGGAGNAHVAKTVASEVAAGRNAQAGHLFLSTHRLVLETPDAESGDSEVETPPTTLVEVYPRYFGNALVNDLFRDGRVATAEGGEAVQADRPNAAPRTAENTGRSWRWFGWVRSTATDV